MFGRFGSEELKQRFLRPSIAGEVVACLGVSEVGAGSDVSSVSLFERYDPSRFERTEDI